MDNIKSIFVENSNHEDVILLKVNILPNSSKNSIVGIYNSALKVKIQSPPVDGKANKEVIKFLSKTLKLSKSKISIVQGELQRNKVFEIRELSKEQIIQKLIEAWPV